MADPVHSTLGAQAARQLANTTKTPPQWIGVTPRWLVEPSALDAGRGGHVPRQQGQGRGRPRGGIGIECSPSDADDTAHAVRRLRGAAARVHAEHRHHDPRGADPHLRPLPQPDGPGARAARRAHRDGQGAAGERARQQRELRPAQQRRAVACGSRRARARPRPTTSTSSSPGCGRSRRSSWRTRAPSRRSGASAPAAASRRPR